MKLENSSRKMAGGGGGEGKQTHPPLHGVALFVQKGPLTTGQKRLEIRVYLHQGRWRFFVSFVLKF